jgi:hypothetical protein
MISLPVTVWKSVNFFKLKSRFKKIKHLVEYHEFSHESEIILKDLGWLSSHPFFSPKISRAFETSSTPRARGRVGYHAIYHLMTLATVPVTM